MQACEVCHAYLLQQWQQHQTRSTPHAERNYLLRKRQTTACEYDTTTFICYACGLEYPSSSLRLLYCRPNVECEPYFPCLENVVAPAGSSPISPQGMVQVCAICYKSIPQRYKVFGTVNNVAMARPLQPISPRHPHPHPHQTVVSASGTPCTNLEGELCYVCRQTAAGELAGEQLLCYVCHDMVPTDTMKLLLCYPDSRSADVDRVMHFPFLKTLATPLGPAYFDSFNRTMVCADCFAHFNHQWQVFESDGLALELRHYTLPPAAAHHHHRPARIAAKGFRTPPEGPVRLAPSTAVPVSGIRPSGSPSVARPLSSPSAVRAIRPSSSPSPNRTPPESVVASSSSPGILSAACDSKDNPPEQSIYCYLCGMNSTSSFAHWLPSAPPKEASNGGPPTPYFPYLLRFAASSRAEKLQEDGSALVCSFCYHMVHSQWKQYEDAPASKSLRPETRVYNTHDYVCYVCGIATYRKRVRALPVEVFFYLFIYL